MGCITDDFAYLTADLPGTGGVIKQRPEDFLVDEQPLYEPSGEGEHLFVFVEKRGATTLDLARRIAKAFRIKQRDVGYAGMKDKHAVTRQHLSLYLPGVPAADVAAGLERFAEYPYATVLWAERHGNKLRRGHHGGNRFSIRIREVSPTAVIRAKPILERLAREGLPNYLGEQRFGYRQNSHVLGRLLLKGEHRALLDEMLGRPQPFENDAVQAARRAYEAGDYAEALVHMPKVLRHDRQALDALRQHGDAAKAVRAIDRNQRDLLVSAAQSDVFNRVLDRRLRDGAFGRLLPGDLAWKHDNRSCFAVDEETAEMENGEQGRVRSIKVSPSGPLWGSGMTRPSGEVLAMEERALEDAGLSLDDIENPPEGVRSDGTRRPLRVRLTDPDLSGGVDEHGPYLRLAFELPRGSYATMAVREVTKGRSGR